MCLYKHYSFGANNMVIKPARFLFHLKPYFEHNLEVDCEFVNLTFRVVKIRGLGLH